jgi:putative SOS response-associated peptidase YedK
MPRILKLSDWQRWLEPGNAEQPPIDLLRSFEAELIKAWRADAAINNITNTGPELGEPVKDEGETQLGCSNLFRVYK